MPRTEIEISYGVGDRTVTVKAMDSVGPEDVYENAMLAVLHRFKTGEDALKPARREVKDFIIKQGLFI